MSLIVLAAGMGSRYGGLKQLDPIGPAGEILLDYSIYDAVHAGFERVIFVIRRDFEKEFKKSIGERIEVRVNVDYVFQEVPDIPGRTKPWGTGEAVLICADTIGDEPFAVVNADDFYGVESYLELASFLQKTAMDPSTYGMVGFMLRNTLSEHGGVCRGICSLDGKGCLSGITETENITSPPAAPLTGDEIVSMNMWGFKQSLFDCLEGEFRLFREEAEDDPKKEFYIPTVVDTLIRRKAVTVKVLETNSAWAGMTNPEDKAMVTGKINALIKAGIYPEDLTTGVF